MKQKYIVQAIEGINGLELLSDPPAHRRRYLPGEEVELDDKVSDVPALVGLGIVKRVEAVKIIEKEG